MKIAGILLAAGRSTRFGAGDKLAVSLHGRPMLDHAAQAMREVALDMRFIVRGGAGEGLEGFDLVRVEAGAEMSRSLAAGIVAARNTGADAALVTLGDMPFVTGGHLTALVTSYHGRSTLLASHDRRRSPPALFGSDWFGALERGTGDAGARALIARARLISAPPGSLSDIDTPEDLDGES